MTYDIKGLEKMAYEMSKKQFEEVTKLSGQERYEHFLDRASDFEELWSLKNEEGFVTMADDDGNECIPFWPHADLAKALAVGSWSDCRPERIALKDLLNKWLPGMKRDGLRASVFPTAALKGVVIKPEQLKEDLEEE